MKNHQQHCKYGVSYTIGQPEWVEVEGVQASEELIRIISEVEECWGIKIVGRSHHWRCYGSSMLAVIGVGQKRQEPEFGPTKFVSV